MQTQADLNSKQNGQLEELLAFLRIPSISTDPSYKAEVLRAAQFVKDKLEHLGFETALLETEGHPAVFGTYYKHDDLPTVLIYGHYDVQPADPVALWTSPPFEPVVKDGAVFARGATDDKGQVYAHILAVESLLEQGELPLNVSFLIEGEEEIGSPHLQACIEANIDRLAADVVVISDGAMFGPDLPTITYGLKGMTYLEICVKSAEGDLHSGAFGGAVPNAGTILAELIASLKDLDGRVLVPGFYDEVLELSPAEKQAFQALPFSEASFMQDAGVRLTPGEPGYSVLERLWARPTLDVNGLGGGFQGEGAKTVIPSEAFAKISCRLVPNQTPDDIFEKLKTHLEAQTPGGIGLDVKLINGAYPALTPIDARAIELAAEALERVYDKPVVFTRTGGTIPVVSSFQQQLGAQVVLVGFGLESDNMHAPDEKFGLTRFFRGIEVSCAMLEAYKHL